MSKLLPSPHLVPPMTQYVWPLLLIFYNSITIHLQQTYANVAQTRRRRKDRKHEMATSSPSTKQHRPQIRHERITSAGCGCSVLTVLSRSSSVFRRSTSTVSSSISLFFSFRSDCVRIDIGVESTWRWVDSSWPCRQSSQLHSNTTRKYWNSIICRILTLQVRYATINNVFCSWNASDGIKGTEP